MKQFQHVGISGMNNFGFTWWLLIDDVPVLGLLHSVDV
jgi:hypothetical protein